MIEELAATRRLLVASDFDGTLAEIVEDPDVATPLARSKSALEALAGMPGTTVAIISGRRRSELVERFDHPAFVLIGEHGADHGDGAGSDSPALTEARLLVDELAQTAPRSMAEHKARSVGFHYRLVRDPAEVVDELRRRAGAIPGLRLIEGKKIVELSDSAVDKGAALIELRRQVTPDRVLFMGDDVTDETAFAVLASGDVGIHVGVGPTLAGVTVSDPSSLADLLDTLVALRSER
jgi:trehalose 6-phosphate phosphatase